jgi:hypothetical protein
LSFTASLEDYEQRFEFVERLLLTLTPANGERKTA